MIEFGVAKGGMSLFLGGIASAHGRRVFALDSFEGLPTPNVQHDNQYFVRGDYASRNDREALYLRFLEACTIQDEDGAFEVRLGLRLVSHLAKATGLRIAEARQQAPFDSADDLARRAGVPYALVRQIVREGGCGTPWVES